jgi:hypothetical protein
MYDGIRHFMFVLPPLFVFTGLFLQFLLDRGNLYWLYAVTSLLVLLPGLAGIARLHPYQYVYYNSLVGGTSQAFRQYETDYWLTCYKDAVRALRETRETPARLYVHREAYIADYYAEEGIEVLDLRGALDQVKSGDYILVNTRTNEDRRIFRDAPPVVQVSRGEAIFCMIKQIP